MIIFPNFFVEMQIYKKTLYKYLFVILSAFKLDRSIIEIFNIIFSDFVYKLCKCIGLAILMAFFSWKKINCQGTGRFSSIFLFNTLLPAIKWYMVHKLSEIYKHYKPCSYFHYSLFYMKLAYLLFVLQTFYDRPIHYNYRVIF